MEATRPEPASPRIIYLVGPRGSGKTTVGGLLAAALNREFVDMDDYITGAAGASVEGIVASRGWEGFRDMETAALQSLARKRENIVAATGGGAPLRAENREIMRSSGLVIWLDAPVETLCARLAANPLISQRPSLTGGDIIREMAAVVAERREMYAACAHHALNGDQPAEALCAAIIAVLKTRGLGKGENAAKPRKSAKPH